MIGRGVIYVGSQVAGGRGMAPIEADFATMAQSRDVNIKGVRMVGPDIRIEFFAPVGGVPQRRPALGEETAGRGST